MVGLESGTRWVHVERQVTFRQKQLFLIPETETSLPCVFLEYTGIGSEDQNFALKLVREFFSNLCFAHETDIRETTYYSRSGRGVAINKLQYIEKHHELELDFLVDPSDADKRLALGLFREAVNAHNLFHRFLNFFRILNIGIPSGKNQIAWINSAIPNLADHRAQQRMTELTNEGVDDLGAYLYGNGRCAVAHAAEMSQTANPDDPTDELRICFDEPIIKALAMYKLQADFQLPRRMDALREFPFALEHPENIFCPLINTAK